jgi:hypothetical protein
MRPVLWFHASAARLEYGATPCSLSSSSIAPSGRRTCMRDQSHRVAAHLVRTWSVAWGENGRPRSRREKEFDRPERLRESAIAGLPINHCQRGAFPSRAFFLFVLHNNCWSICTGTGHSHACWRHVLFPCCLDHNGEDSKGPFKQVLLSIQPMECGGRPRALGHMQCGAWSGGVVPHRPYQDHWSRGGMLSSTSPN